MAEKLRGRGAAAVPPQAAKDLGGSVAPLLALALAAAFAAILLGAIDFPLGTHADEGSKVRGILTYENNYAHPVLMLELVHAANAIAGVADHQSVAELGRAIAVLAGAASIFVAFLLAREALPAPAALAAAAAAVTPLVAMHARYLKEDIFVLLFILLSLLALIRTLKLPTRAHIVLLGLAVGLAAAAKYVAIVLLPFAMAVLLLGLSGLDRRARLKLASQVALVVLAAFALIHAEVLWEFPRFASSVYGNVRHAEAGDSVRAPLMLTYGLFHLRQSLLPGLGAPLTILGILGFAAPFLAPPARRQPLLVIAAFAALWLVAHELSPLKPYPNFHRYMVPVAPLLVILGTAVIYELARRRFPAWSGVVAALVILAAAAPALYASLRIVGPPREDLRRLVPPVVLKDTPDAGFDHYTRFGGRGGQQAAHGRPPPEPTALLVTSSLVYDRYVGLGAADMQPHETRGRANYFAQPYLEVSNGRPAFAFFNPVFRIVALDGDAEHLQRLAAKLRRQYPNLSVTLLNTEAER